MQQMAQCSCSMLWEHSRRYVHVTETPLPAQLREHWYSLKVYLLEKSKLAKYS